MAKTIRSRRIKRLLQFALKPFLAAMFVTLILSWTRSGSKVPRKPVDKHPHLTKSVIIASTSKSNLTWLPTALDQSHWAPSIYDTSLPYSPSSGTLTVPINKGNEAMVYLTYIIDNYDHLPDVMFFHHDHSQAWHQLFSSTYELTHLNLASVVEQGYVSPRCLPGCENIIALTGNVAPIHSLRTSTPREIQIASVLFEYWRNERTGERQNLPEKIAAPCCAQFAVSREAVRRRSRETWIALRKWLIETELDSRSSGRVLEYTWHLWFGMEPVHCPREAKCLCDVYGVGDCSNEL